MNRLRFFRLKVVLSIYSYMLFRDSYLSASFIGRRHFFMCRCQLFDCILDWGRKRSRAPCFHIHPINICSLVAKRSPLDLVAEMVTAAIQRTDLRKQLAYRFMTLLRCLYVCSGTSDRWIFITRHPVSATTGCKI